MTLSNLTQIHRAELCDSDFEKMGSLIYNVAGIKMTASKKIMVQARLKKRLRALSIDSFSEYVKYVFSKEGLDRELIHILDVISTNKTDFFREPVHFDFLKSCVLPHFIENCKGGKFKVWSAGCSSGEEVYTLAMVLNEFSQNNPAFDYNIVGTDISTAILAMATDGIYDESRLKPTVSEYLMRKYFMRHKDITSKKYRVVPELRRKTRFYRVNFMDNSYPVGEKFDAIFCRNVLIYFDRYSQEQVVQKLSNYLKPEGYFFHGHSESLIGMDIPLKNVKTTIFRK